MSWGIINLEREEDFLAETRAPGDKKTDPVFNDSLITNNGIKQGD